MRLGGPIFDKNLTNEQFIAALQANQYSACWCPHGPDASDELVRDFVDQCQRANILIAEVGGWSNTISPDEKIQNAAIEKSTKALAHAERLGATCCVNITGSRGVKWDGPHQDNLNQDTFDLIVEVTRKIIDAVKPTRTFYTLETMPWVLPDSPDNYLRLLKAIDRKAFAVHLDPVNMVNCPSRAYDTAGFIKECFAKLGPYIKSAHGKDIKFSQHLTLHLDECRPGTGVIDYTTFLKCLDQLAPNTPLMLEHLPTPEEYTAAAQYIRNVAQTAGVKIL